MRFMLQMSCLQSWHFVDMSDAVIWLMEYLQDEAKDREEDGRCGREGVGFTDCECLRSQNVVFTSQTTLLTCALFLLVRTCVEC